MPTTAVRNKRNTNTGHGVASALRATGNTMVPFSGAYSLFFGTPEIFNEMAKAMTVWGSSSGSPHKTKAVFVNEKNNGRDLKLVYLDGEYLGDDPFVMYHDSFNANPGNDQKFVRDLPNQLSKVSQKLNPRKP